MALIGKAYRYRDFRQRKVADLQELLGFLDALAQQPLVRRPSGGGAKCTRKMADREIELGRGLSQRTLSLRSGVSLFLYWR